MDLLKGRDLLFDLLVRLLDSRDLLVDVLFQIGAGLLEGRKGSRSLLAGGAGFRAGLVGISASGRDSIARSGGLLAGSRGSRARLRGDIAGLGKLSAQIGDGTLEAALVDRRDARAAGARHGLEVVEALDDRVKCGGRARIEVAIKIDFRHWDYYIRGKEYKVYRRVLSKMIIPIRCMTCGKVLADKYDYYIKQVKTLEASPNQEQTPDKFLGTPSKRVLDAMGLTRYCCRRHMLTTVDMMDMI